MPRFFDRLSADRIAILLWLAVVAVGLFAYRDAVATLGLRDTDDYMRLAQVRDLMAGQGWFDVTQYRINPAGGGGLMHWSRFIDVQIAGLIGLFGLFLTPGAAERWAVALYPLLLVLPLFLLLARILAHLGDRRMVIAGLFVAATGVTFLHYFAPLRIDHHNWQLLLSVAMLWLALGEPRFGRGLAAALVITAHVEISLEGLPYLALFGALFALDWLRDPRAAPRLAGFAAGLVAIPAAWLFAFRGPAAFTNIYCDAFSLPYAAGVAAAAAVLFAALQVPAFGAGWMRRSAVLGAAAVAAAGAFLIFGPSCLGGPFGALEPLVRIHWYDLVKEGRPVWEQRPDVAALMLVPMLIGGAGALLAWRRARDVERGADWLRTLFVLLCSALLSMLVFRTSAVTHAYLVPGFAALGLMLWDWSRARESALLRIAGAMLVLAAVPAVDALLAARAVRAAMPGVSRDAAHEQQANSAPCPSGAMFADLARQPPATVFAPIDSGPAILIRTPHSVVATGHHRNHVAMNDVITAFLSDPATAEPIVRRMRARYLLLCTGIAEIENKARLSPNGLAGRLLRGERVDWLEYDAMLSHGPFRVYRVLP